MARIIYDGNFDEVRVNLEGGITFKKDEVTEVSTETAKELIPRPDFKWDRTRKVDKEEKKDVDE